MVVVRVEVRLDLVLDLKGMGLETLDEEAEIRCGERCGWVAKIMGGKKITDVD